MYKILLLAVIWFLSSACLPRTILPPESHPPEISLDPQESPSLFTREELKRLFGQEAGETTESAACDDSAGPQGPGSRDPGARALSFPIGEESNDDFSLEAFPVEPAKNGQSFDIPIVVNARVEQFIQFFQTTLKKKFSGWLALSEKYIPFMRGVLKENGLPEDLVYMALIESGFNPYAFSRSKASGPWQFIYLTGKRYGLKVTWWVDERRDPEKSTVAAAKYLKDLYDLFECWYLAAAGYNAGEGKIATAMKRYRTEDFWELTKYRYLKQETKDYVPQMIAAALIAKDPEKYGFTGIEYFEPLRYDKAAVPGGVDLSWVARACDTSVEELKDLNPELLRWCTPPDEPMYEMKIPFGTREIFAEKFSALQPVPRYQYRIHTVRKGETLSRVARTYRVEANPLAELNRLKKTSPLSPGTQLLIPLPSEAKPIQAARQKTLPSPERPSQDSEMTYTIKSGDTLWNIANEMGVNIGALSQWNNLHPEKKLMPGDKLRIKMEGSGGPLPEAARRKEKKEIIYVVKDGDSLWSIAKRFNLNVGDIRSWNHLNGSDRIHPADRLKLKVEGS